MKGTQHGFRNGAFVFDQLIDILDRVTEELDNGETVDVIYLDFAEAFDKVPHRRLLRKLERYGISGKVLAWIAGGGMVVEQMAEGGGAWALVGMEKGDEWDPPGIGVGARRVFGVYLRTGEGIDE